MRAPIFLSLLIIIISFSVTASIVSATITPGNHGGGDRKWLIDGSCRLISRFDGRVPKEYCTTVLRNAPYEEKAKLSLHGLAWVSLNVLYNNVSATMAKVDQLAKNGQNDPILKNALNHCTSMYSEANHRAKEALKHMEEKNYTDADRTVSMIQGDGFECETMFKSEPRLVSPLTKENLDTQYLSAMTTLLIRFFDKSLTPWGEPVFKPTP